MQMTELPSQQIPAVYHRRIGDVVVTALSDGVLERGHDMMRNVPEEEARKHLDKAFRRAFMLSVNAFLLRFKERTVLVETGSGDYLGPEAGELLGNLEAAGVSPGDIDAVLLTHMHPDHSAGLTDMTTGKPNFPNAELVVHENEPKHWFDDAAMSRGTEREKKLMFQQAREQCAPYRNRMRTFVDGEVLPGVTAVPCHGHTPGHCGFLIDSSDQSLLIWGDTVHMPEVQVPRPEVTMVVDVDPPMAEASRRRIFDMAAEERLLVTGMHLHFPGFGHIAKDGDSYQFVPEPWQQSLD
jgi:glyoxylase-like metal-dependent hydrolase (beta-lactamase superfamily II)